MPAASTMPAPTPEAELSLAEYLILGLIAEAPTHGFALSRLLAADGPVGRIYRVPRPVIYRLIDRLTDAQLIRPHRVEHGRGPQRTLRTLTPGGRRVLRRWLNRPVRHIRDIRTELLAKLALLERAGCDPAPLLSAQREAITPIVAALAQQRDAANGFDKTLAAWRYQSADATLRFVDDLVRRSP
jgi:PadR family transcriptional regulator AphA